MSEKWRITAEEAENIATNYGTKFVNSITRLAGNYWFLITSLDIFIHNNAKIDDCADLSKISYQKNPIAYIRRKTSFKSEYFEFSIRIG
ncbi:hypothetical protein BDF21DRAFT_325205, partial [Thamnidium elegans]